MSDQAERQKNIYILQFVLIGGAEKSVEFDDLYVKLSWEYKYFQIESNI